MKGRWRYARCGEPKRSDTLSDEGQRPNVKEQRKLESRVQRQVARTVRRGAGRKGQLTDLARCLPYIITSNLLEENTVLSLQASCEGIKRFIPLLCATIGHSPSCYARQSRLSATILHPPLAGAGFLQLQTCPCFRIFCIVRRYSCLIF